MILSLWTLGRQEHTFLYHHSSVVWSTQSTSRQKSYLWLAFACTSFLCPRDDVNCNQKGSWLRAQGRVLAWALGASRLLNFYSVGVGVFLRPEANPPCLGVPCLARSWLVACVIPVAFGLHSRSHPNCTSVDRSGNAWSLRTVFRVMYSLVLASTSARACPHM